MKNIISIDPIIDCKVIRDVITSPIVIRVNKFDEEPFKLFTEEVQKAENNDQQVIPIIIDSYGGYCYSLLGMIDIIQSCSKPVATIIEGKAMSAGCSLAAMGTPGYRFVSPNSILMMHCLSAGFYGKIEEIKATAEDHKRLNKQIFRLIAKNCGHKDIDYFIKKIDEKKQAEWYITPKEAKKEGLIDHIGIPEIGVKVSVEHTFSPMIKKGAKSK